MKLEDQVCSLELSQRLKELGVRQDSVYSWAKHENNFELTSTAMTRLMALRHEDRQRYSSDDVYSAFTVAELGEMLPYSVMASIDSFVVTYYQQSAKLADSYGVEYVKGRPNPSLCAFFDKNEANARAKMLIHLIENKLMEVPQ